jgi:hypothetical protein
MLQSLWDLINYEFTAITVHLLSDEVIGARILSGHLRAIRPLVQQDKTKDEDPKWLARAAREMLA